MSKQTPRAGSLAYRTSSSTTMVPPFAYRVTRPRTVPLTPTVPPKYTTPFVAGLNPRWRGKRYLASAGRLADTEGSGVAEYSDHDPLAPTGVNVVLSPPICRVVESGYSAGMRSTAARRSEEHTSELQSRFGISY